MFLSIEEGSANLIEMGFADFSPEKQKLRWKKLVSDKKEIAKTMLYIDSSGITDTIDLSYEVSSKYSWKKIDKALNGLSKTMPEKLKFEDLDRAQLYGLLSWLETADTRALLD